MISVPNQRIVTIDRRPHDKKNTYTIFDQVVQQNMMNDLESAGAVKLWLYLAKNTNAYKLALSPADCESWGISKARYRKGIEELEAKGYLVQTKANEYKFYDFPPSKIQEMAEALAPAADPIDEMPEALAADPIDELAEQISSPWVSGDNAPRHAVWPKPKPRGISYLFNQNTQSV